ncbi:hypothetical protein C8R44DRAFT_361321 [Mycena epipterygia]|nr:hypothetical protein C8R44DRAFT_361321 [Mycena epipterygia]
MLCPICPRRARCARASLIRRRCLRAWYSSFKDHLIPQSPETPYTYTATLSRPCTGRREAAHVQVDTQRLARSRPFTTPARTFIAESLRLPPYHWWRGCGSEGTAWRAIDANGLAVFILSLLSRSIHHLRLRALVDHRTFAPDLSIVHTICSWPSFLIHERHTWVHTRHWKLGDRQVFEDPSGPTHDPARLACSYLFYSAAILQALDAASLLAARHIFVSAAPSFPSLHSLPAGGSP